MARFLFVLIGLFALSPPAAAQQDARPGTPEWRNLPLDLAPRAPRREVPGDKPANAPEPVDKSGKKKAVAPAPTTLESLYDRLAQAKDAKEAGIIVKQIERRWARSGSDTADLMLQRASNAVNRKDVNTALEVFDHIAILKPEWTEIYHRRATLFFSMQDYDSALRDLNTVLQKEPRHFAALSGLGMIMQKMERNKAALIAYKKALELHPNQENLKDIVKRLEPDVDGVRL